MQDDRTPSFLATFVGSLFNFNNYGEYAKRSVGSMIGHFFLLILVCCGLYAGISQVWFNSNISPFLDEFAQQVPAISFTDGKATVDIEQPHFYKVDGEVVAIIDTTQPPDKYLEEYKAVVLLTEDKFIIKESSGKVESYELPKDDFKLTSSEVQSWMDTGKTWVFPAIFIICFLWQACWKAVQVLVAAGIITLVQSSRPDFATHWKLANLALVPAMLFGVVIYAITLNAPFGVPGAGFAFWAILAGLTYYASDRLRKGPSHS
jgi:uncharacterized protein DUF1189